MRITLDRETFDLSPQVVRDGLDGHVPEGIRSYWVEVDGTRWPVKQVVSLATGVVDRKRFQSRSARRWLKNLGFRVGSSAESDVSLVLEQLRDVRLAWTMSEVLGSKGQGLRGPGMYSWWVDAAGAADLSKGLGHPLKEGIVYAGLAGATRSGGSTSTNTLWGRIATMHLGRKHEFSTLRRSIGSVLAAAAGQPSIDEAGLTRWMHAHLRVVAIPVADPDTLDGLETDLLLELDPPLNLAKVPSTPLRSKLAELRRHHAARASKARTVERLGRVRGEEA